MNDTNFTPKDSNIHQRDFSYDGKNVEIYKFNHYTSDFLCDFNLKYYPFDYQNCNMELLMINAKENQVVPNISVLSRLDDFSSLKVHLKGYSRTIYSKYYDYPIYTIHLNLERDYSPLILNTYLPTAILTVLNQLTNYVISYEMFDAIIAINATIIITLSAMFIAVFDSLPQTTYIKMIDIWMIVTFMYPFIIIFLHSVLYVLIKKNRQSGISKQDKVVGMLQLFGRVILPGTFLVFLVSYWTFALLHMNSRRIMTEGIFDNNSV